ncbi:MAG: NAD(P)H-dependent oxidoreductase subunit E [Alphaproteobacteria bacterium]|nr:NAD(P)H-dependent oxidoreductase subunit E [Alphaproteobacteria bacterium]
MAEEKEKILEDTKKMLVKWKSKRGALIMALHEIQGAFGYVPWSAMEVTSKELGVPMAQIYSVLTFYNYFKLKAPGKVVISVCDGTACHIKGAPQVIEALEKHLGVAEGQTTPDGLFYTQIVRCLGCCGLAPVVVVNGKTYGKVTDIDVPKIIAEWREKMQSTEQGV